MGETLAEKWMFSKKIEFTVFGKAQSKGSKRHIGRGRIIEDNQKVHAWMQEVKHAAWAVKRMKSWQDEMMEGPLAMKIVFVMVRPKSHYGTGRNEGRLKPSAPDHPIVRPDSFKLVRAVEDALSGLIYKDDSQICTHNVCKRYGRTERCEVFINEYT